MASPAENGMGKFICGPAVLAYSLPQKMVGLVCAMSEALKSFLVMWWLVLKDIMVELLRDKDIGFRSSSVAF